MGDMDRFYSRLLPRPYIFFFFVVRIFVGYRTVFADIITKAAGEATTIGGPRSGIDISIFVRFVRGTRGETVSFERSYRLLRDSHIKQRSGISTGFRLHGPVGRW